MFFPDMHKREICSDHDDEALARNAISICYGHTHGVFDPETDSPLVRILYNSWASGNARDIAWSPYPRQIFIRTETHLKNVMHKGRKWGRQEGRKKEKRKQGKTVWMRKKREGKESLECRLSYHKDEERNTTDREKYYVVIFHKLLLKLLEECSLRYKQQSIEVSNVRDLSRRKRASST